MKATKKKFNLGGVEIDLRGQKFDFRSPKGVFREDWQNAEGLLAKPNQEIGWRYFLSLTSGACLWQDAADDGKRMILCGIRKLNSLLKNLWQLLQEDKEMPQLEKVCFCNKISRLLNAITNC